MQGATTQGLALGLLDRVRDGDRGAFDALVVRYWGPVVRYLLQELGAEDARDAAQRLFLALYGAVRRGGGPRSDDEEEWRRYLFASARRERVRQRRAQDGYPIPLADLLREDETELALPARDAPEGEQPFGSELREALLQCISRLEDGARRICLDHFFSGRSKREIARDIHRPESSVRLSLARALHALRRCIEAKGMTP